MFAERLTLLPFDVRLWNVVRIALLALFIDVVVGKSLHTLWAKYNGFRVMHGERVRLSYTTGTRLGPSQQIDGNSWESRALAIFITALILSSSVLIEYGSLAETTQSTSPCMVESLHSSRYHPRLLIDLREMTYEQGGKTMTKMGGITTNLRDIQPTVAVNEREVILENYTRQSNFICPEVDKSVMVFMQHGTEEEVQIVRGRHDDILLQKYLLVGKGQQWAHIRSLPFDWDDLCEGGTERKELLEDDGIFIRLLWKSLIKAAEGFTGAAAMPYREGDEGSQAITNATLKLSPEDEESEKAPVIIRDESKLGSFLSTTPWGVAYTVTIDGLRETADDAGEEPAQAFPTRDGVEMTAHRDGVNFSVGVENATEQTSAVVRWYGRHAGVSEIADEDFVCMVGGPWVACARTLNESGVTVNMGEVYDVSASTITGWKGEVAYSAGAVQSSRVRESLFNYVVRRWMWMEAGAWAGGGGAEYRLGGKNVVVWARGGDGGGAEEVECGRELVTAAVSGLFYLGVGLIVGLEILVVGVGVGLRKYVGIDVRGCLVRMQAEVLGEKERWQKRGGRIREVGVFSERDGEGRNRVGTLPYGVKAERVDEEVETAAGGRGQE